MWRLGDVLSGFRRVCPELLMSPFGTGPAASATASKKTLGRGSRFPHNGNDFR